MVLAVMLLSGVRVAPVQAELILTSPPRESHEAGLRQYAPLAEYLSHELGETVRYVQPKSWLHYQRDMKADKYDIVFDGPHFISWRMQQFRHTPVARLPGTLVFVVVVNAEDTHLNSLNDMINRKICGIAPPNLTTLTILAAMDNPARQPRLVTTRGGMKGVYQSFRQGKCEAAIFRDQFYYKKFSEEERAATRIIYSSDPITNQGISVSSRVGLEQREKIAQALTQENAAIIPTLKRFAPKARKMIRAGRADYADDFRLLSGIIFGWEIRQQTQLSEQDDDATQQDGAAKASM